MSEKTTKTKKMVKRRLKIKGVLFLLAVFVVLYFGVIALFKVEVKSITIKGTEYLKNSQILKEAGLTEELTFFGFTSSSLCEKIEANPLVKTCKVRRTFDFRMEIELEENVPLFYYSPEASIVLSDGAKMSSGGNSYGIPTLINHTDEEVLKEFIAGLSEVKSDIIRSISEIEYAPSASKDGVYIDKERFIMMMNDGNTVVINNRKLNALNYYDTIYASIGNKKGTFNFDCDFDNYLFTEYEAEDGLQ